ncbi:MAG: glycosyltransferase family 2 protein [Chitinophagaceae bacterium]|nr:MAG: glycosyltransferase family 2 protein [Chitinophagaceae bacterium]
MLIFRQKIIPLELSIIIVNYNVKFFLEQCLFSVLKASADIRSEIIVIDNNSTDGSREYLSEKFPSVQFEWLEVNSGFAKACNRALKKAIGEIILFLNPDTIVAEDCFLKSISFIRSKKDCGALGVRMLDGSGKFLKESKRGLPTPSASFFRLSGITFLLPESKYYSAYYAGHLSEHDINEIDVVAGAFLMVPKAVLEKTGGFDEDFFMYGEDVDLSYRITRAGFKNYYYPQTTILHFKGESTLKSLQYIQRFYAAMHLFLKKHYTSFWKKAVMNLAIGFGRTVAKIRLISMPPNNKQSGLPEAAAIIATQDNFSNLVHLVKHAKPLVAIQGRVAIEFDEEENAIGVIDDLPLLKDKGIHHFIFSEGSLSFKEIIMNVDRFAGKCNFMFHAKGSISIVGSDDSDSRGFFISPAATVKS